MVHKYELKMKGVSLSCPIVSGCHARVVTKVSFFIADPNF